MKQLIVVYFSIGTLFVSGCLVRHYTVMRPRKDLEISGNQGYISGAPPQQKKTSQPKEREVMIFEIELGPHKPPELESQTKPKSDSESKIREAEVVEVASLDIEEEIARPEAGGREKKSVRPKQEYEYYTVRENDTLQKISRRFYGTDKKWQLIYEKNTDVIGQPDKIYPSLQIKIPTVD